MVENQTIKERLAEKTMLGAGNQYKTRDCAAMAVFLADLEPSKRIARIATLERESKARHPTYTAMMPVNSAFLLGQGHAATLLKQITTDVLSTLQPVPQVEPVQAWSYKNAALSAQTYCLACTSHDLATCIMEGFDARRVKDLLSIPDRYGIPMMIATGKEFPERTEAVQTPRLDMKEVVFNDTFGTPWDEEEEPDDQASA
jgi:nitroreductase